MFSCLGAILIVLYKETSLSGEMAQLVKSLQYDYLGVQTPTTLKSLI